jgi:hypothetical protein
LERISKESPDDYWTIMKTLTAFVRERARWREPDAGVSETMVRLYESEEADPWKGQATDIAAVLAVIVRRPKREQERERQEGWRFNLEGVDLQGADLFEGVSRRRRPQQAHLESAMLNMAHLEGADLNLAHLESACLRKAHLEGAYLHGAGLTQAQIEAAIGDAKTELPEKLSRPAHWLGPEGEAASAE